MSSVGQVALRELSPCAPSSGTRAFALVGLYAAISAILLDFAAANGVAIADRGLTVVVVIAVSANLASLALADWVHLMRGTIPVAALIVVHGATRFLGAPRVFDGDAGPWVAAHLLLLTAILVAGSLTIDDVYRALLVTAVLSLGTLALGNLAVSQDQRSIPGLSGRLKGIYGHPNVTAVASVVLLLIAARAPRDRKFGIAVGACTLAATASLTGFLTAIVALFAFRMGDVRRWRSIITTILAVAVATPMLIAVGSVAGVAPGMFTGRVQIWTWALQLHFDRLNGLGDAVFTNLRGSAFPISWFHGHNQVIQDYLTGGYILSVVTIVLMVAIRVAASTGLPFALWVVLAMVSITEVPLTISYPGARTVVLSVILTAIFCSRDCKPPKESH